MDTKDAILQLLEGKLRLLDLLGRYHQLSHLECDSAEANHIIPFDLAAHLGHVLDNLPAVLLDDEVRVTLMYLVGKRLLKVVTPLMMHHVYELIFLNFLALSSDFLFQCSRHGHRMHVTRLSKYHIVLIEPTDDV